MRKKDLETAKKIAEAEAKGLSTTRLRKKLEKNERLLNGEPEPSKNDRFPISRHAKKFYESITPPVQSPLLSAYNNYDNYRKVTKKRYPNLNPEIIEKRIAQDMSIVKGMLDEDKETREKGLVDPYVSDNTLKAISYIETECVTQFYKFFKSVSYVVVRPNPLKDCTFQMYEVVSEAPLEGLTSPKNQKFLREIDCFSPIWAKALKGFAEYLFESSLTQPLTVEFVRSLLKCLQPSFGKADKSPLYKAFLAYAKRHSDDLAENGLSSFSSKGHCFLPEHFKKNKELETFIPPLAWFPENLKKYSEKDLISFIGNDAEREVFSLFLGRVAMGGNEFLAGNGDLIKNDFRTIVLLQSEAGTGKSAFLKLLSRTLSRLGLKASVLQDPNARFNQADALTSNLAYLDDSEEKDVIAFCNNRLSKSAATGGAINTENKGKDAITIIPNAAQLACLNDVPLKVLRSADSGNGDRLALISCRDHAALNNKRNRTELLADVPNLMFPTVINYVCKKEQLSAEVVMAYLLRICLDRFLSFYDADSGIYSVNRQIRRLKTQFKSYFNAEYRKGFLNFCLMADKVIYQKRDDLEEWGTKNLLRILRSGCFLALSKRDWAIEIKKGLEKHYNSEENYYPPAHAHSVFKDLGKEFFKDLHGRLEIEITNLAAMEKEGNKRFVSVHNLLDNLLKGLSLKNGTKFEHSPSEMFNYGLESIGSLYYNNQELIEDLQAMSPEKVDDRVQQLYQELL